MSSKRGGGGAGGGGGGLIKGVGRAPGRNYVQASQAARLQKAQKSSAINTRIRMEGDEFDSRFGYTRFDEGPPRLGWLLDMSPTTIPDEEGRERSALDLYFLQPDGDTFKVALFYRPYIYVGVSEDRFIPEVTQLLQRKFDQVGMTITPCDKEDLDMPNHLSGKLHRFLKLSFFSVSDLMDVRGVLLPIIQANGRRQEMQSAYLAMQEGGGKVDDFLETLVDMREYDVPYVIRVAIDKDLRVGAWYRAVPGPEGVELEWLKDMIQKAEPRIFAFDIECTKAPLKFPDAAVDQVFMISYMIDGQGFLIINREVVSEDIEAFEYSPLPQFEGPFHIFNMADEKALLRRFLDHVQELRPQIFVTYNGDFFDWPFLEKRLAEHGMDMGAEIGVTEQQGEYRARCAVHLDAFHWVKRDSYLPQGAHGLKAVTKYKLGYDPVEIDPEDMVRFASERPTEMASYSVSDAVATYYLYTTYVHQFIFSLCTIIPMRAADVLRKGSGTLCETLLMVEAYRGNIICPNKQSDALTQFHKGHLLESETYVGGHVECLETGVYRSDLAYKFRLEPTALQRLIENLDRDLSFALHTEGVKREDVVNYAEVKGQISDRLAALRDEPVRDEEPLIYHLDVGAMYPNIILTNRLQPCSIKTASDCAACDFNQEKNNCKRPMRWVWRGEHTPAKRQEYELILTQLAYESVKGQAFHELPPPEQTRLVRERLHKYSQTVYKKAKVTSEETRVDTVCMRENPFYVNTVRAFRDRRYEYKVLSKQWKTKKGAAEKAGDALGRKLAADKEVVFDSLQLAHKCILNSFYGYVMRKGARWRSMQMAGIVTDTGARLITQARELVEQIGRPLELDTDGIWCILPKSFPENFKLVTADGRSVGLSYPCIMLNADVHEHYTNEQYQDLADHATRRYETHAECSIYFEVDGPYRAMLLPASTEEGRLLKKRYAVFNMDESLAELKGFELKRRGELELVKAFQGQVFEYFLRGETLEECYGSVAEIANYWLDVLDSRGEDLDDDELMQLISENKTISKTLEDYGAQKGTSLTTAARLADFLGPDMVKDRGLNCRLVIANRPHGAPVTERAIPTAIFSTEPAVRRHFLRKWLKDGSMSDFGIRAIIDWDYYKERLGKSIQKIITIPAAMQKVANPVPRVPHPDWLDKKLRDLTDGYRQLKISALFAKAPGGAKKPAALVDIEDAVLDADKARPKGAPLTAVVRRAQQTRKDDEQQQHEEEGEGPQAKPKASEAKPPAKCPPVKKDFYGWLAFRKAQWRAARRERRMGQGREGGVGSRRSWEAGRGGEGAGVEGVGANTSKKHMGVDSLLRNAALAVTQGVWQIIEVRETEIPGDFVVWAMTGPRSLQRLQLQVERQFLVASNIDHEHDFLQLGGRRVSRFLPRGQRSPFVYEMITSERRFQRNENGVANLLSTRGVTGVFELNTPLILRALMKLGCVAQVSGVQKSGSRVFSLSSLESVASPSHPYLHGASTNFKVLYVFMSTSPRRQGLVGFFRLRNDSRDLEPDRPASSSPLEAEAVVWLANPYSRAEARPPLKRLFASYAATHSPGARCDFRSSYVSGMSEALSQLNSALAGYTQERQGPTIVLVESGTALPLLRRSVPLLNELPVVMMPANADDSRYPALGWQTFASQRMVQRLLLMPAWLQTRLQASRYAHLPLGNVGHDSPRAMADLFFARLLKHNRHVLWASESSKPDLGGAEGDENDAWADDADSPAICVPGAYRRICIELDLYNLAVNSVVSSEELDAMEGGLGAGGMGGKDEGGALGGDDGDCVGAFRLLRVLVSNWLRDVQSGGNRFADELLLHFYRWVCDGDALLHDPALRRLVHRLMAKCFLRLVAELRRLGAKVVFANFHKAIIATNKEDLASAQEYAAFVIQTVLSRDLFQCLQIQPVKYWEQLLFMDQENFCGMALDLPAPEGEDLPQDLHPQAAPGAPIALDDEEEEEEEEEETQQVEDEEEWEDEAQKKDEEGDEEAKTGPRRKKVTVDDEEEEEEDEGMADEHKAHTGQEGQDQPDDAAMEGTEEGEGEEGEEEAQGPSPIVSHWHLAEYLPTAVREYFLLMVADFLYRFREKEGELRRKRHAMVEALSDTLMHADNEGDRALAHKEAARAIQEQDDDHEHNMHKFMQSMVSGYMTQRMLAIVNEIDTYLHGPESFPVRVGSHRSLTRPALEFIKAVCHVLALDNTVAQQVEVMQRLLLTQIGVKQFSDDGIFKDYCRSVVLPDLICSYCNQCRDLDLCRDPGLLSEDENDRWRCPECQHLYDVTRLEQMLVESVERHVSRYVLQDVRCAKCRRVGTQLMADACRCSGKLVGDEEGRVLEERLQTLRQVAVFHSFTWLREVIDNILRTDPQDTPDDDLAMGGMQQDALEAAQ